jgi:spore coat polysaccharide biosynthesis protein SpsF (cytidylyltransferase family)
MTERAPRVIAVIQARMASTRLPGKSLMPLAGMPALVMMLERVRNAQVLDDLLLCQAAARATSTCCEGAGQRATSRREREFAQAKSCRRSPTPEVRS